MTLNKGHVAKIENFQDKNVTRQIWWNLVQKQLRNQRGQGFAFFVMFDLELKDLAGQGHRTCPQTTDRS